MITDSDIKKLKAVFATKDDLKQFATKDDLVGMEKRQNQKFATKDDLVGMEKRLKKEIVGDIIDYLRNNILPLLSEHDKRLDRLEKRVGGFPALA
jgi:ABC-type Fe3+/spermidine/putrescine transport system ATPase subunit